MGEYVKKKKDMVFQSVESLQQIVNVVNEAAAAVNDTDAINKIYADAKFALVRGDKLNVFRVATPVGDDDAVPKKYMNTLV